MIKGKWKFAVAALAATALAAPSIADAQTVVHPAAGKVKSTFVPIDNSTATIVLPRASAGKCFTEVKASDKEGDAGLVSKVAGNCKYTCGAGNNDKGTCGDKEGKGPGPLEFTMQGRWHVLGALDITVGTRMLMIKGKPVYKASGKNKYSANDQPAIAVLFGTALGIGRSSIHDIGPDPDNPTTGCGAEQPAFDMSGCFGPEAAVSGIVVGNNGGVDLPCVVDADCNASDVVICNGGACEIQTCSVPGDCNSGYCNASSGQCCNPATSSDPANCNSPSGAFLDPIVF